MLYGVLLPAVLACAAGMQPHIQRKNADGSGLGQIFLGFCVPVYFYIAACFTIFPQFLTERKLVVRMPGGDVMDIGLHKPLPTLFQEGIPEDVPGRNMFLELFPHNQRAYDAVCHMLKEEGKAAVIHPTGTGKSFIAFRLVFDNLQAEILWLSPSEYIFRTQMENLRKSLSSAENLGKIFSDSEMENC